MTKEQQIRAVVKTTLKDLSNGILKINNSDSFWHTCSFLKWMDKKHKNTLALASTMQIRLGFAMERMAQKIAEINYVVKTKIDGKVLSEAQKQSIINMTTDYKNRKYNPSIHDYNEWIQSYEDEFCSHKCDLHLYDKSTGKHTIVEIKASGNMDNKKSRVEKISLLEQRYILGNSYDTLQDIDIRLGVCYNYLGEGTEWHQKRVQQFFADDEILIEKDFWNFIGKSDSAYSIIMDEWGKNFYRINDAIEQITK